MVFTNSGDLFIPCCPSPATGRHVPL